MSNKDKEQLKDVKADDKEQSQRFVEAAEQLESDKSGAPFHKALFSIKVEAGEEPD